MQVTFAEHMQDPETGLFYHGYNFATNDTSCCFWGRAQGWVLMSHVEVALALQATDPSSPLLGEVLGIYTRQVCPCARWYCPLCVDRSPQPLSVFQSNAVSLGTGLRSGVWGLRSEV